MQNQGKNCRLVGINLSKLTLISTKEDSGQEHYALSCQVLNIQSEENFEKGLYLDSVYSLQRSSSKTKDNCEIHRYAVSKLRENMNKNSRELQRIVIHEVEVRLTKEKQNMGLPQDASRNYNLRLFVVKQMLFLHSYDLMQTSHLKEQKLLPVFEGDFF